jgi:hypothetical protein
MRQEITRMTYPGILLLLILLLVSVVVNCFNNNNIFPNLAKKAFSYSGNKDNNTNTKVLLTAQRSSDTLQGISNNNNSEDEDSSSNSNNPAIDTKSYSLKIKDLTTHPTSETEITQLQNKLIPTKDLDKLTVTFDKKYTPQQVLKPHNQQIQELFKSLPSNSNASSILSPTTTTNCDSSLWNSIGNPGPPRFKMLNPCTTVTGTVTLVHFPPDGDTVLALALDSPYKFMITKANYNTKMTGGIWVEMICQRNNNAEHEPIHNGDCQGFNGQKFPTPKVGDHLSVTGSYILDIREGGHAEIHPAYSVTKIA